MFPIGLTDLDSLPLSCRSAKARSYVAEAIACFKAGAFRASIITAWVAVVSDFIAKLEELALGGPAPSEWISTAVEQLAASSSWNAANPIRGFLVPRSAQLTEDHLNEFCLQLPQTLR